MDEVTEVMLPRKRLAKLLERPLCSGMLGNVEVKDTARGDLHNDQDTKEIELGRDDGEEVGSDEVRRVIPLPADQRLGPDDDERIAPVEPAAEEAEQPAGRRIRSTRLDASFLVHRELSAQEEDLGLELSPGSEGQSEQVTDEIRGVDEGRDHDVVVIVL